MPPINTLHYSILLFLESPENVVHAMICSHPFLVIGAGLVAEYVSAGTFTSQRGIATDRTALHSRGVYCTRVRCAPVSRVESMMVVSEAVA